MWDHGAGPILGYGNDENYQNDNLFMEEIEIALKNSKFSDSNKLEFIGFDACLMASAEVASVLSDYSNYMIASQDLEPGYGWDSESVNIQLKVSDDYPNGTIVGVIPTIDVDDTSSMKKVIKQEEWDYIQFFNSEYNFYDNNGMYTDDWKSSGTVYLTEVSLEKDYEIVFTDLELDYDYYCMFQIHDTQGNVHHSNLVKVE